MIESKIDMMGTQMLTWVVRYAIGGKSSNSLFREFVFSLPDSVGQFSAEFGRTPDEFVGPAKNPPEVFEDA